MLRAGFEGMHAGTFHALEQVMTNEIRKQNTAALLELFAAKIAEARQEPDSYVRTIVVRSAQDAEWYGLHLILQVEAMRDIYDTVAIAERIDDLCRALRSRDESELQVVL
jgi:hypothetical protein